MIEDLKHIEQTVLMDLLRNPSIWNTLDVNYHHPRVERLWTQIVDARLMLHVIHPCKPEEALYHPHPWPSAMHVLSGKYEMGLGTRHSPGFVELNVLRQDSSDWEKHKDKVSKALKVVGEDENKHTVVVREIAKVEMTGNNYYEMLDPLGWHYVRPIDGVCVSLMLIGKPWDVKDDQDIPKKWGKLPELTEKRKLEMLEMFKNRLFYNI